MLSDDPASRHWPVEIKVDRAAMRLEISFDDGARFSFPAELLRVESPSAEIQGHGPHQKQIIGGCRHVGISGVEPVGHYAIRILFDDGHDTGLFSWSYLYALGSRQDEAWRRYIEALAERGLSRDPHPHQH